MLVHPGRVYKCWVRLAPLCYDGCSHPEHKWPAVRPESLYGVSATPLGYGVLPVRTSMYIPKRKGEAQLSVQHGAPRERCCDPPAHPFLCFWVSALLCRLSCIKRWVQRTAVPVSSQLFNGRWAAGCRAVVNRPRSLTVRASH